MDAATAFVVVIALLAFGKAAAHWRLLPESTPEVLNQLVITLCLPASVLRHAPRLEFGPDVVLLAALPWALLALSLPLVLAWARLARWPRAVTAVLLLAVPLGNTAFLGYPLIAALIGEHALPEAVVYDQLGTFLILSSVGLIVIARYADGAPPGARAIACRIARFPPFMALVAALTVMPADPPPWIAAALAHLTDALLPLVAIAVGMQLNFRLPPEHRGPLVFGLVAKLALAPSATLLLAHAVGLDESARAVAVLQSAMPVMITAMALAAAARLEPALGAALVGYSTVLAVLVLPLWRGLVA